MDKLKLTAIIITKNEENNIENCLKGLFFWVDEIIIVDSYSEDQTLIKVKKFKSRIYETKTDSFAERRRVGMSKARGKWLFYVDADERVSEKLKREIIKKINNPQNYVAFMIPRLNIFFGRQMKYGGWFPDYQTRLFKKANLEGFFGKIHESAEVKGNIEKLENPFIHLGHLSITKGFTKSTYWTKIESNLLFEANHPRITIFHLIKAMMSEFFNRLILRGGIEDGSVGWLEGIIQTFNKFLIYSQLWEKQQKSYH